MTSEHNKWGWIGVDFDGTLVKYDKWVAPNHAGDPILPMVNRVNAWLEKGLQVRIFTARIYPLIYVPPEENGLWIWWPGMGDEVHPGTLPSPISNKRAENAKLAAKFIRGWSFNQFGVILPITCVKDFAMSELWDDRAVRVEKNTGFVVGEPITFQGAPLDLK